MPTAFQHLQASPQILLPPTQFCRHHRNTEFLTFCNGRNLDTTQDHLHFIHSSASRIWSSPNHMSTATQDLQVNFSTWYSPEVNLPPPPSQHWISRIYPTAESLTPDRAFLLQAHHPCRVIHGSSWCNSVWVVTLWPVAGWARGALFVLSEAQGMCNAAVAWWWGMDLHCGRQAGRKGRKTKRVKRWRGRPRELEAGQELGNRQPNT